MRLLVTGATGLVGRRLLTLVAARGFASVHALVRDLDRRRAPLEQAFPEVDFIGGDVLDAASFAPYIQGDTVVVHLAAATGNASRQNHLSVNGNGTALLVKTACERGAAAFLHTSTIAVSFDGIDAYAYAYAKRLAEQVVRDCACPHLIVRPTIVLGPDSPIWRALVRLARAPVVLSPGNRNTRIQPLFVDDLAALLVELIERGRFPGDTLEIGGPDALSMEDLLVRIHVALKGKRPLVVPVPVAPLVWALRQTERFADGLLPVSSGQFASFVNDGTAVPLPSSLGLHVQLRGVDWMIAHLLADTNHGNLD